MIITKLADIDYTKKDIITFNATVVGIQDEGSKDNRRPIKYIVKLEDSGETVNVVSWAWETLDIIKSIVPTDDVYKFEGMATLYNNSNPQIRIGSIQTTGLHSTKKIIREANIEQTKKEITSLISKYINTDSVFYIYLQDLIINNNDFWIWPAATKVHHNYTGGLAVHSLNVCKRSISTWEIYKGENLNLQLLVAGSLLHDIGKLKEYKADGSRTIYGNLISHVVSGENAIVEEARKHNIDPDSDINTLMLRHIILSHHKKLEYGAAVEPYIAEAWVVADSDANDAETESINAALANLDHMQTSQSLVALDEGRVLKYN
jgi:3'-5' exoribonuclease